MDSNLVFKVTRPNNECERLAHLRDHQLNYLVSNSNNCHFSQANLYISNQKPSHCTYFSTMDGAKQRSIAESGAQKLTRGTNVPSEEFKELQKPWLGPNRMFFLTICFMLDCKHEQVAVCLTSVHHPSLPSNSLVSSKDNDKGGNRGWV